MIVPAARIIEREPPVEIRWRDRVVYRYVTPDIAATAPQVVLSDAIKFCRPLLQPGVVAETRLVRTFSHKPSWLPLQPDALLVTSMNASGDLFADDYRVRPGFQYSFISGLRQPRTAALRELGEGALWYLTFRAAEAILRP